MSDTPTPFRDAIHSLETANSAGVGVRGTQADGVEAGAFVSKDLGKGFSADAEGGISTKKGWGFKALIRKVWK